MGERWRGWMDKLLLDEILEHYKHPWHRRTGSSNGGRGALACHAANTSCGDDLTLYVTVIDGVVEAATFDGELCTIATYGADMLAERIVGMRVEEVEKLTNAELLGEMGSPMLTNPVRLKCFELAQRAAGGLVRGDAKSGET
jgi:nitrogen fixation NifU-like protein